MEPAARCVLEAEQVEVAYGAIRAVQGASLTVAPRQLAALVGPNGAGKSSFLRALAGVVPLAAGRLRIGGTDCAHMRPKDRVRRLGVALIPEGRGVFGTLTVLENLEMGRAVGALRGRLGAGGHFSIDEVFELFPALYERRRYPAQYLSGGEQQMLGIGRALLMRPALLLMDEPSAGLAPMVVRRIFDVLSETIRARGIATLLAEQDSKLALGVADYVHIFEQGRVVFGGSPADLEATARLRAAYLGGPGGAGGR